MEHKVIFYRDEAGEFRWRRVAANGEKVADSGEGYTDKRHMVDMAHTVNGDDIEYVDETDEG